MDVERGRGDGGGRTRVLISSKLASTYISRLRSGLRELESILRGQLRDPYPINFLGYGYNPKKDPDLHTPYLATISSSPGGRLL